MGESSPEESQNGRGAWTQGDVRVNGIRLHYTRTGDDAAGKPPLVLAHGFSDDGLCWTPVAEALEPDFDIVMVDARGHGRSEAPPQGYGASEQAADLAGVITTLGLTRPAILGHSMGALTTLALAGMYPDIPGAILLEDPPAPWMLAPASAEETPAPPPPPRLPPWIEGLAGKTRDELIEGQRASTPHWSEDELELWADAKLRFLPHIAKRAAASPPAPVDWPVTLRRITCPALLITGDPERGAIITDVSALVLQDLVPQLKVRHIAGAGHSIHRDRFEAYRDAVQEFLNTRSTEGTVQRVETVETVR